ncbi:TonB-dependent siderophore receptor [Flavobacterium sp. JP2137]|uniref:TonB-dependent siderophore receptor n=1 Tax=Flavobacterium sp. JP2137 TaxID=3414510 RepID=UPI003D2FF606
MRAVLTFLMLFSLSFGYAQNSKLKGRVNDENNKPIAYATVFIEATKQSTQTNERGEYTLRNIKPGVQVVKVQLIGYVVNAQNVTFTKDDQSLNFSMTTSDNEMNTIELYTNDNKNQRKVQNLTRLPLKIKDQVQSISIVSDAIIKEQGALTITDAARNVAGVTLFNTYGGVKESMSIRGFRGTPVLRNGVMMDSDFRTASAVSDMQGVESVQVIKGSAAVTQGFGDGLGSAGGVINVVTKSPNFRNQTEVGFRGGSWNQIRPTVDFEQILDKKETVSLRVNAAYEKADGFRINTEKEKIYINPSLEWKVDEKSTLNLEMDYLGASVTPDKGTINLGEISENKLYEMPHNKFLGFKSDRNNLDAFNYSARFQRELTDNLSIRIAAINSISKTDNLASSVSNFNAKTTNPYERTRSLSKNYTNDKNSVVQIDLVGKEIQTGVLKHTFQVGFDYRQNSVTTEAFGTFNESRDDNTKPDNKIDVIDVSGPISNDLPDGYYFVGQGRNTITTPTIGFMAQDFIEVNPYIKAVLGLRYSRLNGNTTKGRSIEAWDPLYGLILSPTKNINVFGSYTTTSSNRSSNNELYYGGTVGTSKTKQIEFGFKSDWLNERLSFNFTYFILNNENLAAPYYTEDFTEVKGKYILAGDLKRTGFEVDITGKITNDLQVMLGYAYLDAQYKNSPSYVDGSAPMNAPNHTVNAWANYQVSQGALKGLSVGFGAYYVGDRPVNEYSMVTDQHGTTPGIKPFDMPSYLTLNAQVSYTYKNATIRVFGNNLADQLGYTSYFRGGNINEIDPRNFAAQLSYKF